MKAAPRLLTACATLALLAAARAVAHAPAAQAFTGTPDRGLRQRHHRPRTPGVGSDHGQFAIGDHQLAAIRAAGRRRTRSSSSRPAISRMFTSDVPGLTFAVLNRIAAGRRQPGSSSTARVIGRMLDAAGALRCRAEPSSSPAPAGSSSAPMPCSTSATCSSPRSNPSTNAAGQFFVGGRFDLGAVAAIPQLPRS